MRKIILSLAVSLIGVSALAQKPSTKLLNPTNHALVMIDHQGQMGFATHSINMTELRNNVALVSGAANIFKIPTLITTVAEKSFSGPVFPEILEFFPKSTNTYIDRTTMNTWEDKNAHKAIVNFNKKKVVFAGLWTSVCIVGPVLSAIDEGYDVYFIADASGDITEEIHNQSVHRMIQAGATPITSMQYLLELQRDWARQETYTPVNDLVQKYGGSYGIGIQYTREMLK